MEVLDTLTKIEKGEGPDHLTEKEGEGPDHPTEKEGGTGLDHLTEREESTGDEDYARKLSLQFTSLHKNVKIAENNI